MSRRVIDSMKFVTDFDELSFLKKLTRQVEAYQESGFDVEVQYGGRGTSGPLTALVIARGVASSQHPGGHLTTWSTGGAA